MAEVDTQVAIIGAGPGGYAAAFLAADLGLQVTLIDPEPNPGGVCLYRGCIPSKALLHIAAQIIESRSVRDRGVVFGRPKIQTAKLRSWKNDVVAQLTGGLGQLVKQRRIQYRQATAAFEDHRTLTIRETGGSTGKLSFENAIIATGSHVSALPVGDVDSDRLMDSSAALELETVPKKLLVIGGGYIGLEIGTVYAALGSKVTLVEMTAGLLPGVDRDLVGVLRKRLNGLFEKLLLETTVKEVKAQKNGLRVVIEGADGRRQTRIFERVLAAVGRRPTTSGLGLENAGVQTDERGFIRVDGQQRTSVDAIFAIGDAADEPMLAHKASHQGRVAAEVIAGRKVAFEPVAIPAVVFTDPEIAWAGLTETEAKEKSIDHTVSRFPWAASGRAATLGRGDGLTKLLVDPQTERILGVGLAGVGAGELIAEGVLAIEMGANATDLGLSIHPHPTLSETIMEAAEGVHGTATSYYRPKKKSK
ncbi:MAG: dihydrolipoyl dehydrogenase [Desulfobacterales bacterium]